jgi:hypothetical protein
MTFHERAEGAAVGFREGEQGPVEVAELAIHTGETFLTLRQAQAVEVGDDIADERQPDGDDHCDHGGRC